MKKGFDISSIIIEKVIVHTIPKHKKDDYTKEPRYSESICQLTDGLKYFFKDKIVNALGSDRVFRIVYDSTSTSPVALYTKDITEDNKNGLIENSKKIAKHLYDVQSGNNNEGILVTIEGKISDGPACIIIKLEMDKGAQLVMDLSSNSYDIKEIEDLMLTQKTKVYKVALLFNHKNHNVEYNGLIADNQIDTKAKQDVSSWFINKFLGCTPFEDSRITTQHFFNYTRAYINTIDDDAKKAKYIQDLNSYLQKNTTIISPQEFADDYLSTPDHKNNYKSYLDNKKFKFSAFTKDISQVERQVQKITIEFANDISIIGKKGIIDKKVKLETLQDGQTKAEIISRVKKIS